MVLFYQATKGRKLLCSNWVVLLFSLTDLSSCILSPLFKVSNFTVGKLLHCLSLFFVPLDSYQYLSISQLLVIVCKSGRVCSTYEAESRAVSGEEEEAREPRDMGSRPPMQTSSSNMYCFGSDWFHGPAIDVWIRQSDMSFVLWLERELFVCLNKRSAYDCATRRRSTWCRRKGRIPLWLLQSHYLSFSF